MMPRNSNATTSTISCDDKNETTRTDDSFQGVFRKGKPEPAKVISIVARFSLGLLIPALYMLVLGAVAYVTFHHALFGLHFQRASSVVVNGFQYLLPLFSGAALLALLLRPFFPLRRREHRHYEMQDDNGRDLLTFAEKISQQMAIPSSLKLTFSLQPELHIKPDNPWHATRGHLTLTAGLPLLAVINTRQLGALISHQLAHHSNSILTPVQRTMTVLDRWFTRSISGDDGWLDRFQAFEQSSDNSLLVATGLVGKTAIIGSNYLLRGLYYLYKALSRPVLLSLEKDADLNAVLMAGSQAFSEALELQQKVQMSWQTNLQHILNDGKTTLVDDFAGLVKKTIDRDTTKDVLDSADPASTRMSLRPLSERIADARADNTQGILALDIPVRDLFRDFPRLCKQLTPFFYRELGLNFSMQDLQPVMLDDQQHRRETRLLKQLAEYTSSTFLPDVVWDTACAASIAKMSDEKKLAFIEAAIKQFRTSLPEFGETLNHYQNSRRKSVELISLNARLEQNYVDGDFVKQQTETLQKEQHKFQRYNDILGTYRRCSGLRISCAVLLLQDRKKKLRGLQLLGYLQTLHGIQKDLHAAYLVYELIRTLYGRILEHAEIELQKTLETQVRQLTDTNRLIYATLVKLPGKLKGVDSLSSLLDEQLQDARGKSTDPTKQALNVFATLAGLYRNLNQNISGQLACLAGESERQRNIQPVRLIPKDGHKNAA